MAGFLDGFRVLDLTDEKGHLGGRILGDMGADVIKIEPPGGDPARNIGPFYQGKPGPDRSLSWFYANANKRGVTLDLDSAEGKDRLRKLVKNADLVIESFKPGHMDRLDLGHRSLREVSPGIITVSLSPFGQSGPYRDFETTDLVSAATGGLVYVFGDADRPPVRISSPQAYFIGSQHAAIGAVSALHHRKSTGEGQWVDVSIQEAAVQSLTYLIQHADQSDVVGLRSGSDIRTRPRLEPKGDLAMRWRFPCQDGYVFFSVQGGGGAPIKSGRAMVSWANEEGYASKIRDYLWEEWDSVAIEQSQQDLLQDELAPFIATKTKSELLEQAAKRRILLAPVNTVADLTENPQLSHRQYWQKVRHPDLGTSLTYPGPSVKVDAAPQRIRLRAPRIGEHNHEILGEKAELSLRNPKQPNGQESPRGPRPIFEGLRIADFTTAIAGPLITRFLASHGAEVIKLESHGHPDSVRLVVPYKDAIPGIDRSTQFAFYNYSKRSIAIDLGRSRGREIARKLIGWSDILVENMAPGAMKKWRLDYEACRQIKRDIIYLSSSSIGRTGPLSNYAAWGYHHSPLVGISHLIGWPDREPCGDPIAYTDSVAPGFSIMALIGALIRRDETREGAYIDQSQIEAGSYFLGPAILDYTVNGNTATRRGNEDPDMAPHGVFPCRGEEQWVAIAVSNQDQWERLCRSLGKEECLGDKRFSSREHRKENERILTELISEWTLSYSPEEVMGQLQSAGVPAGVVANARDLLNDPHLTHRQHFDTLDHEEIGRYTYEKPAIRFSNAPFPSQMPAPLLGEHTDQVLGTLLGYPDDEIADLLIDGVITTEDDMPGLVSP